MELNSSIHLSPLIYGCQALILLFEYAEPNAGLSSFNKMTNNGKDHRPI